MAIATANSGGWEILDVLGINTDKQLIYEVVITIKHDDAVRVTIKRYVDIDGLKKSTKRYNLVLEKPILKPETRCH